MKVFASRVLPEAAADIIQNNGHTLEQWHEKRDLTQQELIAHSQNADAVILAGRIKADAEYLQACSHLKVVSLFSAGFDNIDVEAATKRGIPIGHTPDVLSKATADTALLLMMATSRKAFYHYKRILDADWGFFEPTAGLGLELENKTLGNLGLGSIGFEMAKRSRNAFNMDIIYHNRSRNEKAEEELGAKWVSFDELLAQSDVLSVHANLNDELKGIFNREAFAKMKPTSIFVNTARGPMHNEADLAEALRNGTIWGAGLDVTNPEPMDKDNPLLTMPNVCVLPHIGSAVSETRDAMAMLAAQNAVAGLKGEKLPRCVNPEVYK